MEKLELIRLELNGFGRFRGQTFELQGGLNLIEGANEAGKSTLQAFIGGMFYGFFQPGAKRRSYTALQERYRPWDGGSYRGVLVCRKGERTYRIERDFDKDTERVRVFDGQTGEDLTDSFPYDPVTRQAQVGQALLGLSRTAFDSTANIAQLGSAGVARQEFAAEVSDRLLAMTQTADAGLSLNSALQELDRRAGLIGSPKKSKTPYGKAALRLKELEQELEQSLQGEAEYIRLCREEKELQAQVQQLQQQKELLEAQIRQSAAQELGGRYLKAQNLQVRIERLQKEQERCAPYSRMDLTQVEQALHRLGARAQISRTLEKYRRAISEVEKRTGELETLYRTLEVSGAKGEDLEQFDRMMERYAALGQLREELRSLYTQQEMLAAHLQTLPETDAEKLEGDLRLYRQLEEKGNRSRPAKSSWIFPVAVLLCVLGLLLLIWGALNREVLGIVPGILCLGVGVGLGGYSLYLARRVPQNVRQIQQDILDQYGLDAADDPAAQLEALLHKAQVSGGRRQQVSEQQELLAQELAQKSEQVEQRRQEMLQYLCRLTGRETESADEVRLKALRESVSQAKRLRGDLQRLHLQRQQLQQEEENCQNQMEQIDQSIAPVVAAAKEAAASKEAAAELSASDSLERCRQGKLRYDSLHTELQMQQELLTETLGGYSFEQLEQAVRVKNPSEPSATAISPDRQQARQQLQLVNTQLTELSAKASQLAGLRQGREESLRPSGQIQSEIQQLQQSCDRCQFELDALALAKEKLLSLGGQLHRDFAPRLNARVSQAVAKATGGKYARVVIDQSLGVRLEDREQGRLVALSDLSNGAIDLVYLIVRLELLELLCDQDGQTRVPVLLDDSFAQLDDLRTARLLAYLRQRDEAGTQVLLFSCHSRERAILEKAGIACHTLQLKTPQRRAANEREGNQNGNPTDRGTDPAADQDGGGAGR